MESVDSRADERGVRMYAPRARFCDRGPVGPGISEKMRNE